MNRPDLVALYRRTLASLSGETLVRAALSGEPGLERGARVVALGKAACAMARGAALAVPGRLTGRVAAHVAERLPPGLELFVGGHPLPDAGSEAAGRALLETVEGAPEEEPVLFLVSGGGSAIAAAPAPGLGLADKIAATRVLLHSGAAIDQVNAVRKHLSAIKGGQLGVRSRARRALALVLSDVPSGALDMVASGPTCPDPTTFAECLELVRGLGVELPEAARARLERGAAGLVAETPKPGDARLARIEHRLLAGPSDLAPAAAAQAAAMGFAAQAAPTVFQGQLDRLFAELLARAAPGGGPRLFALAGEPALRVPADAGSGGRMQHLALLLARALAGRRFQALCAGSDGRDGPTAHAGAIVDGGTAARARALGIDLDRAVERFDSAPALATLGAALPAFASGTNLTDLVLVNLEK